MGSRDEPVIRRLGDPDAGNAARAKCRVLFAECDHTGIFPQPWPAKGELVYCRRCETWRHVGSLTDDYRCVCSHGSRCVPQKSQGADLNRARAIASEHVLRRPGHQVEILNNWQHHEWCRNGFEQDELPFAKLQQDRHTASKNLQESLRDALDKPEQSAQD